MQTTKAESYQEQGFFLAQTSLRQELAAMRKRFVSVFDAIAQSHGLGPVREDRDIEAMYRSKHRHIWVAAYDQLRHLPEVVGLCGRPEVLDLVASAGIEFPALAAKPILRVDMPFDAAWDFPAHQDFPYNQGSANSITIWIPFQDVDVSLGALQVVPRSHLRGIVPVVDDVVVGYPDSEFVDHPVTLGQSLVFSQLLVHRSGKNVSERIRFSMQLRYNDLAQADYQSRLFYRNEQVAPKSMKVGFEAFFPALEKKT